MPSATATLPIENEGAASSLVRVPVAVAAAMLGVPLASVALLIVAVSVSLASNTVSPVACTVKVLTVSPGLKVSVPELAV